MSIDLKDLQRKLAENKVYDAWPFILGFIGAYSSMSLSHDLAVQTYEHQRNDIKQMNQRKLEEARDNPGKAVHFTWNDLKAPKQTISGIEISDSFIMRKSVVDFFHYGRVCIDFLYQIVNASLLGDEAKETERVKLSTILAKLNNTNQFQNLITILNNMDSNSELLYLREYDNYTKHINEIAFLEQNSLFFGNSAEFKICAFQHGQNSFQECDVIPKLDAVQKEIDDSIDAVFTELLVQIPNAIGNTSRHHNVSFKSQMREADGKTYIDYVIYFIEVDNGINELPTEISVLPLVIKSDGEIENHSIDIDKIFITLRGQEEDGICGIAEEIPGQGIDVMYRKYKIMPATKDDFYQYFLTFKNDYIDHRFEFKAMEGSIVIYK